MLRVLHDCMHSHKCHSIYFLKSIVCVCVFVCTGMYVCVAAAVAGWIFNVILGGSEYLGE